jgi:hypothetical protein
MTDDVSIFYSEVLDKQPNKIELTSEIRNRLMENLPNFKILEILKKNFAIGLDFDIHDNVGFITHECLRSLLLIIGKTETRSLLLKVYRVYDSYKDKCLERKDEDIEHCRREFSTLCKQYDECKTAYDECKTAYDELYARFNKALKPGRIYKVTNKKTQEFYIGQCWTTIRNRLGRHLKDAKKANSALYKNIKEHGSNEFEIELLSEKLYLREEEPLNKIEEKFIKEYREKAPEKCLNTKSVGVTFECKNCGAILKTDPHRENSTHKCKDKKEEIPTESA